MARSLRRQRVAAWVLLVIVAAFSIGSVDRMSRDRTERSEREQCETLDTFARNLGSELGADEQQIQDFIDQFHEDSSC